jgi:hypothetical protein
MIFYNTALLSGGNPLTADRLSPENIRRYTVRDTIVSRIGSGTATVIYRGLDRIALLTCAHVVDHPDTVITYYMDELGEGRRVIQSISVKRREQFYVIDILGGGDLKVLAVDPAHDLALLGKKDLRETHRIPVLAYPAGDSRSLEWGSFVYLMGYPMGFKMITQGIVSNPNMDGDGAFLVDALFNRGFSGGIVLAIRDGVPNFELVGLAKSVSAEHKYVLRPLKETSEFLYDTTVPYTGDIYVRSESDINYGITHAISVETIRRFVEENRDQLMREGYDFSRLFQARTEEENRD